MLDKDVAIELAEVLTDIPGKSRMAGAMKETVLKLQKWCLGGELKGRPWTPEAQARWLVDEACTRWSTWQGYGALHSIFLSRFPPPREVAPEKQVTAISGEEARKYIRQLLGFPNSPTDRHEIEALEECLRENATSAAVAKRVIRESKRRAHCPNLYDLKMACECAARHVDLPSLFDDLLREDHVTARNVGAKIELIPERA